jgi:hypothetical protein
MPGKISRRGFSPRADAQEIEMSFRVVPESDPRRIKVGGDLRQQRTLEYPMPLAAFAPLVLLSGNKLIGVSQDSFLPR